MIYFYLVFIVVALIGIRFRKFNEEYLSREATTAIKGIFVVMVFFSHFAGYVDLTGNQADIMFRWINSAVGQLMVVMFLFYSGYGMIFQVLRSRQSYLRSFLRRRFLPLWIQFSVCVAIYILLDCITGRIHEYSVVEILLAFTGWTSVGNSNWFIFVYFALYLLFYVVFRFSQRNDLKCSLIVFSLGAVLITAVLYFCKESWWWNTLLALPLGMWFGYYKSDIERFIRTPKNYYLIAIPLFLVFAIMWFLRHRHGLGAAHIVYSLVFAMLFVMITVKVKLGNRVLTFFGNHIFSIYILQRIPMRILQGRFDNTYVYFSVCFVITLLISVLFDYTYHRIRDGLSQSAEPVTRQ